jgi:hypothetical protein
MPPVPRGDHLGRTGPAAAVQPRLAAVRCAGGRPPTRAWTLANGVACCRPRRRVTLGRTPYTSRRAADGSSHNGRVPARARAGPAACGGSKSGPSRRTAVTPCRSRVVTGARVMAAMAVSLPTYGARCRQGLQWTSTARGTATKLRAAQYGGRLGWGKTGALPLACILPRKGGSC